MGVPFPLESFLFDIGCVDSINSHGRVSIPTVASVTTEAGRWIVMDDVSGQLSAWRNSLIDSGRPDDLIGRTGTKLLRELMDSMAEYQVRWETVESRTYLQKLKTRLVPQEMRLRRFEGVFREWLGGPSMDRHDSPPMHRAKEYFSSRRANYLTFLERLPKEDRRTWVKHMQDRDSLVTVASDLPVSLLHGDLKVGNIGLVRTPSAGRFVLIDWEIACLGNPALDVYQLLSEPFIRESDRVEIADYYFDRYLFHGGRSMDRRGWDTGVTVAVALRGLCWLPHIGELIRRGNYNGTIKSNLDLSIEATRRALHEVDRRARST